MSGIRLQIKAWLDHSWTSAPLIGKWTDMQEYIEAILDLQSRHGKNVRLTFAIMTSEDTHNKTETFLKDNQYFGAESSQVTLIKQEKVGICRCLSSLASSSEVQGNGAHDRCTMHQLDSVEATGRVSFFQEWTQHEAMPLFMSDAMAM